MNPLDQALQTFETRFDAVVKICEKDRTYTRGIALFIAFPLAKSRADRAISKLAKFNNLGNAFSGTRPYCEVFNRISPLWEDFKNNATTLNKGELRSKAEEIREIIKSCKLSSSST